MAPDVGRSQDRRERTTVVLRFPRERRPR